MARNPCLEAAVELALMGLRIVPMQATRKRSKRCEMTFCDPCQKPIEALLTDRTAQGSSDPEQIAYWWSQRPQANVGVLGAWSISAPIDDEPGDLSLLWGLSGIIRRPQGWVFLLPVDFEPILVDRRDIWSVQAPDVPVLVPPSEDCDGGEYEWHSEPTPRILKPPPELLWQVFPEPFPEVDAAVHAFFVMEKLEAGEVWRARELYDAYCAWATRVHHEPHPMHNFARAMTRLGVKRWRDRDPNRRRVMWRLPDVLRCRAVSRLSRACRVIRKRA
ncbi:MAG: hypothetical protein RL885_23230 [Planctomycetota bacterium]